MISGGAATLVVDACDDGSDLELAALGPDTAQQLRDLLPAYATINNPLDITGGSTVGRPELITGALELLGSDPQVDLTAYVCPFKPDGGPVAPLIERVIAHASSAAKPTFVVSMNANALGHYWRGVIENHDAAVLQGFQPAMRALAHVANNAAAIEAAKHRLATTTAVAARSGAGPVSVRPMPYAQARALLEKYGFTFPRHIQLTDDLDLKRVRDELGFPLVLKVFSPDVPHKTEAGAVRLGIMDADSLASAFAELSALAAAQNWRETEFVAEEMLQLGAEFIMGLSSDPTFGPVAVAGAGGVLAELLPGAVTLALPPFEAQEAAELASANPTICKLVSGFRGPGLRDPAAFPRLFSALSRLACEHPNIHAVDLNPIAINAATGNLVAVDVLIEAATTTNM
jgi:acyl-CoA synthetase (NDP forming)